MNFHKIFILIFGLLVFSSMPNLSEAQDEKTDNIDLKTKLLSNNSIILLSETTPPNFDGKLYVDKEYADVQPVSFPCDKNTKENPCPKNKYAKVYVKQTGGVLYFGFYVPKSFAVDRYIQIGICNDPEHVATFTYNPLNVHRVTTFFKEFVIDNNPTLAPMHGGLAKADTAHKNYWTAEIKLNLKEIKINPGMLGQQLYITFAISDMSKKSFYAKYFQGWHTTSSYLLLRSKDNWGKENPNELVTTAQITKAFQHDLALNNIYLKADKAFKKNDIKAAIKWLELLLELDDSYYMVASKVAELYFNTNELEKAMIAVNSALKTNPYFIEARTLKGGILLQMGKKEEALKYFHLLYVEYPSKTEIGLQVGKIYIDLAIQAKEAMDEAKNTEDEKDKQQKYKKLIITTQSWFDGLAIDNLSDIRVLLSIASIVLDSKIDINLDKFIKLAEKLVDDKLHFGASLVSFYCFNRQEKSALETTQKLVDRFYSIKQAKFDEAVKFQAEQEKKIKSDPKLSDKEKSDAVWQLNQQTRKRKNFAYIQLMEMVSELADIFKKHNIFSGYSQLMQKLYELLDEKHYPHNTLEGTAAEEKVIAEYMVSRLAIADFDRAAKAYELLKKIVTSTHSGVSNYIEAYQDVVNYAKYWEDEQIKRKAEADANLPMVKIHTKRGVITCLLYEDDAPNTVKNFIHNIQTGIYTKNLFHRVEPAFIIQGGFTKNSPGNIATEVSTRKFFRGTLGMANVPTIENSESTQLFVSVLPIPWLNGSHTVFGRVIEGLEIVDAITENDAILKIEIVRKREKTDYTPVYSKPKPKQK